MDMRFRAAQICNFVAVIGMNVFCGFLSSLLCVAGTGFFCSITGSGVGVFWRRTAQLPLNLIARIGVLMSQCAIRSDS